MNLIEFLKDNSVSIINGIYYYDNKRKRSKNYGALVLPKTAPNVVKDFHDVARLLNEHGLSIAKFDSPVLRDVIMEHLGCSPSWAKKLVRMIYCLKASGF